MTSRHLWLAICLVSTLTLCAAWAAPADDSAAATITVHPARDNTMLLNPGKGFVQYYGSDKYTDDMIGVGYTRPTWSVIEPQEGQFNWKPLDDFIAGFRSHGKKVAFGVINFDGGMGRQYSIPKWVFDAGAVPFAAPDDSTPTHTIILPKTWDDPVYLAKMKQFIAAFGARYDGNQDIEWIDIRDYGNSGESNGDYGVLRNCSAACYKDNYLAPYIRAFPKTQLIVPWGGWFDDHSPEPIFRWAVAQGVGMRRDGICSQWSKDGSETLFAYGHEPIVFEYGDDWPGMVKKGTSTPEALMKYVEAGKPSYLQFFPQFYEANPDFCHKLVNRLGYHFILQQATIPNAIKSGAPVSIEWTWLNDGVAPLHEPCHVAVALLDPRDRVVQKQWLTGSNPKSWMPDVSATETVSVTFPAVTPRSYKLAVGLFLDKKDANPAYRLGIQGRAAEGWYVISDRVACGP